MKIKAICFPFMLFTLSLSAQTTLQWSDSLMVAATPLPITAPRVTLLSDGAPFITWGVSSNPPRIWSTRLENGAFTTPVSVVQGNVAPDLFGFGGYDVAVSDSQIFVVFEQTQTGIMLARSDDSGLSFNSPVLVQSAVSGGYVTLASVVVDGSGNPVVSYILDKNGATYQVQRSTDGGLTFQEPVIANAPAAGEYVCECCTSDMLASGDSIWLVFRNNNQNLRDIWISRSTDLAVTFDVATDVDSTDWMINACPVSGPRMARAHDQLLTAWMSKAGGTGRIYLSTAQAGSMQAMEQLEFPPALPQTSQAQPDVVASGDTMVLAFVEKLKDIVIHFSTSGTSDLAPQVSRIVTTNHALQYPSLAFGNGVVHLVYVDVSGDKVFYRTGAFSQISGVAEAQSVAERLYPNPTNGLITFKNLESTLLEIRLQDARGQVIQVLNNLSTKTDITLDLQQQPAGVYFLQIRTTHGWQFAKVIKT